MRPRVVGRSAEFEVKTVGRKYLVRQAVASGGMTGHRERMLSGGLYLANDPDLVASRRACRRLLDAFNATRADDDDRRQDLLHQLLGSLGDGSVILPRLQCD